jgi:hypothetical protein
LDFQSAAVSLRRSGLKVNRCTSASRNFRHPASAQERERPPSTALPQEVVAFGFVPVASVPLRMRSDGGAELLDDGVVRSLLTDTRFSTSATTQRVGEFQALSPNPRKRRRAGA